MASLDVLVPKLEMSNDRTDTKDFFVNFINLFDTVNPAILTRTADTGQIDPEAIPFPVGNPYNYGYIVYKFQDSHVEYYLRFYFSTGGIGAPWTIYLSVGTGTNGSGTLTGSFISNRLVGYNGGSTTVPGWNMITAVDGFLFYNCYAHSTSTVYQGAGFCLSRLTDMSGVDVPDRLMIMNFRMGLPSTTSNVTGIGVYDTVSNTEVYFDDSNGATSASYSVPNTDTASPIITDNTIQGMFTMPQSLNSFPFNYDEKINLGKVEFFLEGEFVTSPYLIVGPYYGRKQTLFYGGSSYMPQTFFTGSTGSQTCLYSKWV